MQDFTVASGIILDGARIAFVQNRRRNGSLDWSTPGGVVDPGEQVLEALGREVVEETALHVAEWSPLLYSVDVDFVGRDLTLHAQVFRSIHFTGELHIDDPDQVVIDGRWVDLPEAKTLLGTSPLWVAEPLIHALDRLDEPSSGGAPRRWRYEAARAGDGFEAVRLDGPDD